MADCKAVNPGPSLVRRLNRFEYNNTVRDLLGDTSAPASDASFPHEEQSYFGLDNNANLLKVNARLIEAYQGAAEKLAATAVQNLQQLVPCAQVGDAACEQSFIADFGAKAFRRPLSPDETTRLTAVFDAGRMTDFPSGVRMVIEAVLQSPPFLYRIEFGAPPDQGQRAVRLTSWEMASRLSYALWQTMPDDQLRMAAQQDALNTDDEIAAQVQRMSADPKAHAMVQHFHEEWLQLEKYANLSTTAKKDPAVFPNFSPDIAAAMSQESHLFLDDVFFSNGGNVAALFTAPYSFMNSALATYYGIANGPSDANFVKVNLDPTQRLGFLTQGGLLSVLAKPNQTGPVQRGYFVRTRLLCQDMPPPPPGVVITPPQVSSTLSTRQRFAEHEKNPYCASCHKMMDPIGLSLEDFDGAGAYRTTENGQPIDASGEVLSSDVTGTYVGAPGLAQKLSESQEVTKCVSTVWFQYLNGREIDMADACSTAQVRQKFAANGFRFQDLLLALTQTDAFLYRNSIPPGGDQ